MPCAAAFGRVVGSSIRLFIIDAAHYILPAVAASRQPVIGRSVIESRRIRCGINKILFALSFFQLQQSGDTMTGTYTHDQGRIHGTVSGSRLIGTWSEAPSYSPPNDAGDFEFTLSNDCATFSGNWRNGSTGSWSGSWLGTLW
jgi:hypothetical protein